MMLLYKTMFHKSFIETEILCSRISKYQITKTKQVFIQVEHVEDHYF